MTEQKYISHTIYEGAPELLMNRIHEVEAMLTNYKIKTGENDSWKFWKRTSDIMKFAWDYMQDLAWVIKENYQLKQRCAWLESWNAELMTRVSSYEHVRFLITQDKMDEVISAVEKTMQKDLKDKEKESHE